MVSVLVQDGCRCIIQVGAVQWWFKWLPIACIKHFECNMLWHKQRTILLVWGVTCHTVDRSLLSTRLCHHILAHRCTNSSTNSHQMKIMHINGITKINRIKSH